MELEITGIIWYWRGPSPFYFVTVPAEESNTLKAIVGLVTYGWGMVPVSIQIGETQTTTALIPKNGAYLVPLKDAIRKAEKLNEGDTVTIKLTVKI